MYVWKIYQLGCATKIWRPDHEGHGDHHMFGSPYIYRASDLELMLICHST